MVLNEVGALYICMHICIYVQMFIPVHILEMAICLGTGYGLHYLVSAGMSSWGNGLPICVVVARNIRHVSFEGE